MAIKAPPATLKEIDVARHRFLWSGCQRIMRGSCKVNWDHVCRPKGNGGLGVLHLDAFFRALRQHWLWHEWKSPHKLWVVFEVPYDRTDWLLFAAATKIMVGNGESTLFWLSAWARWQRLVDFAPLLFSACKEKQKSLCEALHNNSWIGDLDRSKMMPRHHMSQAILLWMAASEVTLRPHVEDDIVWRMYADLEYSTASAYKMHFQASIDLDYMIIFWKAWAPSKCKFFAWLAIQNMLWTADRLYKRGWPSNSVCTLCWCLPGTSRHLLVNCRFTRCIWGLVASWTGQPAIDPSNWLPNLLKP